MSLEEMERLLESATCRLGEQQLPNIFNYATERTLFDKGIEIRGTRDKFKAVDAKLEDVKEQSDLRWKLRAERGQIGLATIAAAISVFPLRTVFADSFKLSATGSIAAALVVAALLATTVYVVRNAGLRKH